MTKQELIQIAHNIENSLQNFTEENVIDYVNENFFTFSEGEKVAIINETINEFYSLPFC